MSVNRVEEIKSSDGRRLWRVFRECHLAEDEAKVAVAIYEVIETTGIGPNVINALSYTWDDTRKPAVLNSDDEADMTQMAADAESNFLEGWLDEDS